MAQAQAPAPQLAGVRETARAFGIDSSQLTRWIDQGWLTTYPNPDPADRRVLVDLGQARKAFARRAKKDPRTAKRYKAYLQTNPSGLSQPPAPRKPPAPRWESPKRDAPARPVRTGGSGGLGLPGAMGNRESSSPSNHHDPANHNRPLELGAGLGSASAGIGTGPMADGRTANGNGEVEELLTHRLVPGVEAAQPTLGDYETAAEMGRLRKAVEQLVQKNSWAIPTADAIRDYFTEWTGCDWEEWKAGHPKENLWTRERLPSNRKASSMGVKDRVLERFAAEVPALPCERIEVSRHLGGLERRLTAKYHEGGIPLDLSTKHVHLGQIAALLHWAERTWGKEKCPAPNLVGILGHDDQSNAHVVLTPGEFAAVLAMESDYETRLMLEVLYTTGIRRGECCNLDHADVGEDTITVNGKTGKREVPIDPRLRDQMRALQGDPHVFTGRNGERLTERGLWERVHSAFKGAGLSMPKMGAHVLRHTAGTEIVERTGDIAMAGQVLGHTQLKTTQLYAKPRTGSMVAAMRQINLLDAVGQATPAERPAPHVFDFSQRYQEPPAPEPIDPAAAPAPGPEPEVHWLDSGIPVIRKEYYPGKFAMLPDIRTAPSGTRYYLDRRGYPIPIDSPPAEMEAAPAETKPA